MDLLSVTNIENIKVWNRTDCCGEALTNFYVFVSDNPFTSNTVAGTQSQPGVSTYSVAGQAGTPTTISLNRTGRYVRVQLGIYERRSVAEVQVFGPGGDGQVRWLVSDQLGTPRMIFDQSGNSANMQRHDYLPFGEELFAPTGGRSSAMGYASGDGVRQQFTSKEPDVETGLYYFLARYYASTQGRFTGVDPYDINLERQNTSDPEEADALLRDYISQPQHWNRYAYGLNNPLKYVDPNGREEKDIEYDRTLLGEPFKIKFSPKIDENTRTEILANIDRSIDRINNPANRPLTPEEQEVITSMNGIKVTPDIEYEHMAGDTFMIRPQYGLQDNDGLTGAMVHDSHHAHTGTGGVKEEKKASSFTVGAALKIGLSDTVIQVYCRDAKFGHKPPQNNPYKKKSK